MKIGVIGCGRISGKHFEAIAETPGAECIACCDILPQCAQEMAQKYSIPFWTSNYQEMLEIKDIDMISVCTPSGLHPEHGILAAKHGKHVISEKPLAVRSADAAKLIKACNKHKVRLFVVFQNRLNPSIQLIKKAINQKRFGKIYMIMANVLWTRPQTYYDMAPWRGTWALDGGAFMNQASHYVDIMQWLGGPAKEVSAHTAALARNIEAEDTGSAVVYFENNAIGSINVTMLTYPTNLEGSITIIGETGTAKVNGIALNKIEHWFFNDHQHYDDPTLFAGVDHDDLYGQGHKVFYENVIKLLDPQEHLLDLPALSIVDGQEGIKAVEIIEAFYKSSRTGTKTKLR